MDGVFNMQEYYARGGFRFVCRDLRFEGRGMKSPHPDGVVEASSLPFERIDVYDRRHFPAPRSGFLRSWIQRPGGHALADAPHCFGRLEVSILNSDRICP